MNGRNQLPPIARTSDPISSKVSADEYDGKKRQSDCDLMLALVAEFPGKTVSEYGVILFERGVPFMRAARIPTKRLSDLIAAGEVEAGDTRRCTQSKRLARTHFVKPRTLTFDF